MIQGDTLAAQGFPVYDYRYRADPESPFSLYDCLAPALKKHVRIPKPMLPPGYVVDIKLYMSYSREKMALKKEDLWLIKGQLKVANDRILIQKETLKSIDSYIEFEIDGRKVPQFFKDYREALADREK